MIAHGVKSIPVADKRLQTRSENNLRCMALPNPSDWEDIFEQLIGGITFSPSVYGDNSADLDVKLELSVLYPHDETVSRPCRKRLSLRFQWV